MRQVTVAPKGMGLNDFVAKEEGFFEAEGLDVSVRLEDVPRHPVELEGLQVPGAPAGPALHQGQGRGDPGRLHVGHDLQRLRRHGQVRLRSLRRCRPGRSSSGRIPKIREPKDLKDIPISVGMRAGSHFNVPYRLEKYLPLENIKTVNTGGFGARLKALLDGEVEAASLLPPQIAMAEQLGLRKIIDDTFHTIWWVPAGFPKEATTGYLRALDRAEKAMDANPEKYLPLWKLAVPAEFENYHKWDFSKFGRGERFVYKTIPHSEFDEIMDQVKRWKLDDFLQGPDLRGPGGALAASPLRHHCARARRKAGPFALKRRPALCQHVRGLRQEARPCRAAISFSPAPLPAFCPPDRPTPPTRSCSA